MSNAIGRARVNTPGTIYTPDVMSAATVDLFRSLSTSTTTYPTPPAVEPVELGRQAYQLMYDHRAKTLPDLVAALHANEQTVMEGIRAFIIEQTGFDPAESATPAIGIHPAPVACPVWCTRDHTGEVTELDGMTVGTLHERILAELTGQDPAYTSAAAAALVLIERSDEAGEVVQPERIVLALAEGAEAHYVGSEGVQGWTGTPEQAEALAVALLEAARITRQARA